MALVHDLTTGRPYSAAAKIPAISASRRLVLWGVCSGTLRDVSTPDLNKHERWKVLLATRQLAEVLCLANTVKSPTVIRWVLAEVQLAIT
jgi:hypothetical protein